MLRSSGVTRLVAALSSVLIALGTLTACGSSAGEPKTTAATAAAPATRSGAFPVTIKHKFGETTIPAEPQRIVTIGLTDQDAVLALGKVPVGTTEWFGRYPGEIGPWAKDRLGRAPLPTVLKETGNGPQVEKIAALRPDLIVALNAGITKQQYETLSKFAPVVAHSANVKDWGISWQEQTSTVGRALGQEGEAARIVADVEATFTKARAANPDFRGKSVVAAMPWQGFFVYSSQDIRTRMLTSLGFSVPANLDAVVGEKFGASISKERSDLLDQDVVVWLVPDVAKDSAKLHQDPLYMDLGVVEEAREVYVGEGTDYGVAYSFASVLSLPYVIDRLVPQLKTAIDGDPATKVEQPAS